VSFEPVAIVMIRRGGEEHWFVTCSQCGTLGEVDGLADATAVAGEHGRLHDNGAVTG
jgi:hypothetical protein